MGNPNCCFMIIAVTFFFSSQSPRGTVTHWSNLNTFSGMESAFFSEISFRTVYLFQAKLYWLKCVVTWQVQNQSNLLSTKYGEISSKLRTKSFLLSSDLSKAWSRDKFLTNQQVKTDLSSCLLSHNKKPECMRVKRVLSQQTYQKVRYIKKEQLHSIRCK